MSVVEQVRQNRKDLARVLNKHVGIRRIVEDLYPDTAHFIYELLQNAEDTRATEASFVLSEDRLTFEHNGRAFDEADIWAITDIGAGSKAEDEEQIGRFGIGFKAVFAYTDTPRIWSPNYAFEISEMVLPSALPPNPDLGSRTRFEFPFNSAKKPQAQAFREIRYGLEDISDNTLLFLSHIEEIQWTVECGREVHLLRIPLSDHHLEILHEVDGRRTESSYFLRFREPVDGLERQHVAVAFELTQVSRPPPAALGDLAKQFRIVPAEPGRVAVYFTAAKETSNLRFHLHAPFVPELSRSSIKETPANKPHFRQLAALAARSLSTIRDLGLLDREFLSVLPNDQDKISGQYIAFMNAIVNAMKECPLTPKHASGHAPANHLLQAEAGLKDLLDRKDIRFLTDGDDDQRDWAVTATQKNNRVDRFLRSLNIEEWGVKKFLEMLEKRLSNRPRYFCYSTITSKQGPDQPFLEWMRQKPPDWHRALYALFQRESEDDLDRFDEICIVRCSDGQYRIGKKCYFPTPEAREDSIHPRVAEDTYAHGGTRTEQTHARMFLEGIGVCEVGERQRIEAVLKQRYHDPASIPSWKTYESDLRRFISLVEEDRSASTLFKNYFVLQGADRLWYRPTDLYLDSPYLETGLEAYYAPLAADADRNALSDCYQSIDFLAQFVPFVQACGLADSLEISTVTCANNPNKRHLKSAPGTYFTDTGIDRDYTISNLCVLLKKPTLALSHLVWNTLSKRSGDTTILQATYRRNQSNEPHFADSQLVHQLRHAAWIPQRDIGFVRPAEANRDLLLDGFPFDPSWPWLTAIKFGTETEEGAGQFPTNREIAASLGLDEAAFQDAVQFGNLRPDVRQRFLAEHDNSTNLPTHKPGNPDRRAESVRREARKALKRKTKGRQRTVPTNRDLVKREKTAPYLRDLYTNEDGEMICQACQVRLPFKLADGQYYYEAVEFLPELKTHHHQNYLTLCPNHAAMFRHANASKERLKDLFLALDDNELKITLADRPVTVYFTDTHIADLGVVIEVDDDG